MPLKHGSSQKTVSANVSQLMHEWHQEGHLGTSHPAEARHAQKQAVAIALDTARRSEHSTGQASTADHGNGAAKTAQTERRTHASSGSKGTAPAFRAQRAPASKAKGERS